MDTKLKKRANVSWLNLLFGPIHLNFIAPFSLETSFELLKQQEDTRYFRRHRLMVDLIPDDADTIGFHLKHRNNYSAVVDAQGYLKRWEMDSTLVIARVNLARVNLLLSSLVIVSGLLVIAGIYKQYAVWFVVPIVLILIFNIYIMYRQRDAVACLIEETLRAEVAVG